jgi:tetratricopeptide (TPR) repeat protein
VKDGDYDRAEAALNEIQFRWEKDEISDSELVRAFDSFRNSDPKLAEGLIAWVKEGTKSPAANLAFSIQLEHQIHLLFGISEAAGHQDHPQARTMQWQMMVQTHTSIAWESSPSSPIAVALHLENAPYAGAIADVQRIFVNPYLKRGERLGLVMQAQARSLEPWRTNSAAPWDETYQQLADYVADTEKRYGGQPGFEWLDGYLDSVQGERLRREEDFGGAIAAYGRAIAARGDPGYMFGRGLTYALWNRHDSAIADFGRAIALNKDFADAYCQRGLQRRLSGQLTEALTDLDKAVELDPLNPEYLVSRASVLVRLNRGDEARADATAALTYGGHFPWVQYWVSYLNRETDPAASAAAYKKAVELAALQGEAFDLPQP